MLKTLKKINWPVVITLTMMASTVLADASGLGQTGSGDQLDKITSLADTVLSWVQGIALIGGAISLAFAGYTISTGSSEGSSKLKMAIIGLIVTASAVVIAQFVKGQM